MTSSWIAPTIAIGSCLALGGVAVAGLTKILGDSGTVADVTNACRNQRRQDHAGTDSRNQTSNSSRTKGTVSLQLNRLPDRRTRLGPITERAGENVLAFSVILQRHARL